jgi:O-antigen ligase
MAWRGAVLGRLQSWSWYLLLLLLPFSKAAIEISFFLLLIGWVGERLRPRTSPPSLWTLPALRPIRFALAGYLAFCLLATLSSTDPYLSLEGLIEKTIEYALLFVMAVDRARDPTTFARSLNLLMVSSGLVVLDGLAQEFLGKDPARGYPLITYGRMTGPYENPTDLATFLMVVIPIAITLALTADQAKKPLRWGLVVLLSGCLIRTESLGAWVGLAIALPLLLIAKRFRVTLGMFGAALLAGGGAFLQAQGRLAKVLALSDVGGFVDRIPVWQTALGMIRDRPLLGQGLNTFMANYLRFWVGGERMPRYAHNCFLQTAAEIGLIGLAVFVGLLAVTLVAVFRGVLRHRESRHASLLLGVGTGLVAFVVQSVFDTNFYALRQAALFWTLAGLAVGSAIQDPVEQPQVGVC